MRVLELSKNRIFKIVTKESEKLKRGEIRIKTAYTGLSFTDIIIQKGLYRYQKEYMPTPYIPGFEATGTITEVGDSSRFYPGDKVAVLRRSGCFAEEIVATESEIILLPKDTDLEWACSLLVNFFTAFHALNNIVVLQPGSQILITSAGGGVGGILTQLASRIHEVTALVGSIEKKRYVESLGAQDVFEYSELEATRNFDAVFTASSNLLKNRRGLLKTNGKFIIYGFQDMVPNSFSDTPKKLWDYLTLTKLKVPDMVYDNHTIAGFNIIKLGTESKEFARTREAFLEEVERRTLTKHQLHTFNIDEYRKAIGILASREHVGKVLLRF